MATYKSSALLAVSFLGALASAQQNCTTTGVHMIVARASTEKPGTGIIGAVATQVQQQIPGSDIVAVDYPATLDNYLTSESQGVSAMTKLVNDYAVACPNSKMVLMGYSQGAQVTADTLCGTSEANFNATQPVSAEIASKVAAVVLMGDPSHTVGASFDQGTSTKNGIFPRRNVAACNGLAARMVSFCNDQDTFCDSGPQNQTGIDVHISYVQTNGDAAVKFIVSKAKGA
ncbi:cutinase [Thozetella sp. PMI_491]|nr:cutinase [Thozetella sp. PMI_491]